MECLPLNGLWLPNGSAVNREVSAAFCGGLVGQFRHSTHSIFGLEQKSYLLTLTDKATKFEIVRKIANKEAATVLAEMEKIIAFTLLPFKTITSDNGTEFALHSSIEAVTGSEFYFADAYSSWQRGLNEHQNGLIRDFYPKKTDFREISDADIAKVENNLNNRPRKALGFLTPAEAMFNYVTHGR